MSTELDINSFLEKAKHLPVIDVRSPQEFEHGHIPTAVNIHLFNNEERARVGTLYKQTGRQAAIAEGFDIVGPKMKSFVTDAQKISVNNEVLVHCWRGGMRSTNFAWLLNTYGIKARTLEKGYKAYRNYVLEFFSKPIQLLVLGGETGSGKTEILKQLAQAGEQVVDLEKLAHHKGSSFGALGEEKQPTGEQFENNLFAEWENLDFSKPVWIEDEAKNIGKVFLPNALWQKMKAAPIIRIRVPKKERINKLVEGYGKFDKKDLQSAIVRIEKRLGGEALKKALDALESNNLAEVADITLYYYDKAYNHDHEKRSFVNVHFVEAQSTSAEKNAELILSFVKQKRELIQEI